MVPASKVTELFTAELANADPVRLALAIARVAYPDLEPESYLLQLNKMTQAIAARIEEATPGGARALALVQALRLDLGLRGNTERYDDPANSYLNIVLERRVGLPIMLSLILVAIGQGLGLKVDGAGFPGHFMARYSDEEGTWFLDPFHGAVMTPEDVPAYFMKLFGQSIEEMAVSEFAPVTPAAWAQRILNNLHAVYLQMGEFSMLAKVLPLMLVLQPVKQELWQELGLVEYRRGELGHAARALRRYFYLQGHLVLSAPNSSVQPAPPLKEEDERQLWKLLEEIEAARTRWN